MPYFFNPDCLTPEQQSRWDSSVNEYERVMHSNIARYGISSEWLEPVGHPKSALFARLLDGKEALLYPPPKSGGYPWYQVIENPEPHAVKLESRFIVQCVTNQGNDSVNLFIEDSLWKICHQNEAALKLIAFLKSSLKGEYFKDFKINSEDYSNLINCLKERPEWIVRFGKWPEYRLYMGRTVIKASKSYAFRHELDLRQLGGTNPKILKTHIANPNLPDSTKYINFGQSKNVQYFAWLENILNNIRHRVLFDKDWIEYECDTWVVERV